MEEPVGGVREWQPATESLTDFHATPVFAQGCGPGEPQGPRFAFGDGSELQLGARPPLAEEGQVYGAYQHRTYSFGP